MLRDIVSVSENRWLVTECCEDGGCTLAHHGIPAGYGMRSPGITSTGFLCWAQSTVLCATSAHIAEPMMKPRQPRRRKPPSPRDPMPPEVPEVTSKAAPTKDAASEEIPEHIRRMLEAAYT